jgi:hypothetical protein
VSPAAQELDAFTFCFFSILLGGFFAIRFKNKLHYIMAFAAGVLLGVDGNLIKRAIEMDLEHVMIRCSREIIHIGFIKCLKRERIRIIGGIEENIL